MQEPIPSNDDRRRKYDAERKPQNDNSFDFEDETMRTGGVLFNRNRMKLILNGEMISLRDDDTLTRWVAERVAPRYK